MTDAILQTTSTRPVLRFERHLADPPESVWRALTQPEELKAWFPSTIETDEWKVGAALRFLFDEHTMEPLVGTVLEYDEPRRLAYTWGEETLRFELTPEPGGTLLVLTDELDRAFAARNSSGWEVCLERLAGRTVADDMWKRRFDHYVAAFEPELGHQEGPPAI
jgi:uncharacterized protein YndB with AHSA1/START domain